MRGVFTQQVRSFVHVSDQVVACRRQLLEQRVGVPVEGHVLDAAFRGRADRTETHLLISMRRRSHTAHHLCSALYLVPLQPPRSMSSSGVDSMMAWTSDFSRLSVSSGEQTDQDLNSWTYQTPLLS